VSDLILTAVVFVCAVLASLLGALVVYCKSGTGGRLWYGFTACFFVSLLILLGTGVAALVTCLDNPIVLMYAVSQFATRSKRTPAVMTNDALEPEEKALIDDLESNYPEIKEEVYKLLAHQNFTLTKDTYDKQNTHIGSDTRLYCKGGQCVEEGWKLHNVNVGELFNPAALEHMPTFCDLAKRHGDTMISSVVSLLPGKTKIPPHVGYSSLVKRLMLAVEVPEPSDRCYLCVNGEKLTWTEGKTFMWDDTYPHGVWNETESRRLIIYMDVLRKVDNKVLNGLATWLIRQVQSSDMIREEVERTETKRKII